MRNIFIAFLCVFVPSVLQAQNHWLHNMMIPQKSALSLESLSALDSNRVCAAGYGIGGDGVYLSSDAGKTWEQIYSNEPGKVLFVEKIAYLGPDHIVFLADSNGAVTQGNTTTILESAVLFTTFDGGKNWSANPLGHIDINAPSSSLSHQLAAFDNNHLACPMNRAGIALSSDGGLSWAVKEYPDTSFGGCNAIAYLLPQTIIMQSHNRITHHNSLYITSDLGEHWSEQPMDTSTFERMVFLTPQHAFAVGMVTKNGYSAYIPTIFESLDSGQTWSAVLQGSVGQGAAFMDMSFDYATGRTAEAVGTNDILFRSTDRGRTWFAEDAEFDQQDLHALISVVLLDSSKGIVGCDGGYFMSYVASPLLAKPVIVDPLPSAACTGSAQVDWLPVNGALSYDIQIQSNNSSSAPIVDKQDLLTTSYLATGLPAGQFFIRVRARSGDTFGNWATTWVNVSPAAVRRMGDQSKELQIYPNPVRAGSTLHISGLTPNSGGAYIEDVLGRIVAEFNVSASSETLPLPTRVSGLLRVVAGSSVAPLCVMP